MTYETLYTKNNTCVFIPARAGSKRLVDKNLLKIRGATLIDITIMSAITFGFRVDDIYLYTDIDEEKINSSFKIKILPRDQNDAVDTATADSYIQNFIYKIPSHYENILLLQPTSPFRPNDLYQKMYSSYISSNADVVATGTIFREDLWQLNTNSFASRIFTNDPRRQQDRPVRFIENGLGYLINKKKVLANSLHLLKWEFYQTEAPYDIDINNSYDLEIARLIDQKFNLIKIK